MNNPTSDQYINILMQIKGDLGEVKGRLRSLNELQDAHNQVEARVLVLEKARYRDKGFVAGVAFLAAFLAQALTHFKGIFGL